MDNTVFTIDGLNLRLWVTELKRSFAVTDTEILAVSSPTGCTGTLSGPFTITP